MWYCQPGLFAALVGPVVRAACGSRTGCAELWTLCGPVPRARPPKEPKEPKEPELRTPTALKELYMQHVKAECTDLQAPPTPVPPLREEYM